MLIKVEAVTFVVNGQDKEHVFNSMRDFWNIPKACYVKSDIDAEGITVFIKTKKGVATLYI